MKTSRNHTPQLSKFLTISAASLLSILCSYEAHSSLQLSTDTTPTGAYVLHSTSMDGFGFTVDDQDYIFDGAEAYLASNVTLSQSANNPLLFSLYVADSSGYRTGDSLVELTTDPIDFDSGEKYRYLTPTSTFTLQANQTYVLLPHTSIVWFDYYKWSYSSGGQIGPSGTLWTALPSTSRTHDGGATWQMANNTVLLTKIYATPVPEPSSLILSLGIGAAAVLLRKRLRSR